MARGDSTPVWRALADPTRRKLLDILKERPRTTGELCARFRVTRFAVMKHLRVLARARLVLVERRGRERWNHLNAAPIERIRERWLREAPLKAARARPGGGLGSVKIEQEFEIAAPPARVFEALTREVAAWWAAPVLHGRAADMRLDARVGGLLFEDRGGGDGASWGAVVEIARGRSLEIEGAFGIAGATCGSARFDLAAKGGGTVLKLTHRAAGDFERPAGEVHAHHARGWKGLLGVRLKAWVETGKRAEQG